MKYLKLFERFDQPEGVKYFMDIISDKLLELEDIGFETFVQDNKSLNLLEKMIRVTIKKRRYSWPDKNKLFSFSDCRDLITDILITNKELNCFKDYHVIITYNDNVNQKGSISLDYDLDKDIFYLLDKTPISDISEIRYIEIFFE